MNKELQEIVRGLEADHRELSVKLHSLERWVMGEKGSPKQDYWDRFLNSLVEIRDILKVHSEVEEQKLFTVLRLATGEDSDWQLGMTEMQDALIFKELERLGNLVNSQPRGISLAELKESTAHLTRWIQEHIAIEEKFIFPKALKQSHPPQGRNAE
jgi:hemerythrin-like domain-containing protein